MKKIISALCVIFALAFGVFATPALANAACQNLRAQHVLKFLIAKPNAVLETKDWACGSSSAAVELRVMDQLAAGELEPVADAVENFLAAHAQYERSHFWGARLVRVAQTKPPFEIARAAYDLAVKIAPYDADFWYLRGDFFAKNQMSDQAAASFNDGIRAQPAKAAEGYLRLGTLYFQLRKTDQALDAFQRVERAEDATPTLPKWQKQILFFYIAEIYRGQKNWTPSATYYQRALDTFQKPGWPTYAALVGKGDVLFAQGAWADAHQAYTGALDFAADQAQRAIVYAKLANWYVAMGELDRALDSYTQAVQYNPDDPWLYMALAQLQEQKRQLPQALANYQKALRLNPNLSAAQKALERLGAK